MSLLLDCSSTKDCTPSRLINDAFKQASLCISGDVNIAKKDFSQPISFPDEKVSAFGKVIVSGGCVQYGNDPMCEAQKAAQNKIYDADYGLKKADCELVAAAAP